MQREEPLAIPSLADFEPSEPFALLENSRAPSDSASSMFFWGPCHRILATDESTLRGAFEELEAQRKAGRFLCGYLTYEAGYVLAEKKLFLYSKAPTSTLPLLSFCAFSNRALLCREEVDRLLDTTSEDSPCAIHSLELSEDEERYRSKFARIHAYIREGDTYQVNYTLKYRFGYEGSPIALYRELRARQRVEYGAYLHFPEARVASLSPELFLRRDGSRLTSKPMKGTARRGAIPGEDDAIIAALRDDPKTISENVMIVDLLRNDIGRVAIPGSVRVRDMFEIQTFETLHQMVSTVEGRLGKPWTIGDIFGHLFPCGSITGAPKLRTMEIIEELEDEPRGIYTGAVGYLSPSNDFCFNVPIRTVVSTEPGRAEMGIGSGIIHEAVPEDEFAECLLKGRFLTGLNEKFELIESMRHCAGNTAPDHFDAHLARLEKSARFFGFTWRRAYVVDAVREATGSARRGTFKLRLLLAHDGRLSITLAALPPPAAEPLWLFVCRDRVDSSSVFQYHKTTMRARYERALERAMDQGAYDILFLNERDEVAEATRHNLFLEKDGEWLTPPLNSGILDGIGRRLILADRERRPREARLTVQDVLRAERLFLTNAVRGLVEVKLRAEDATDLLV